MTHFERFSLDTVKQAPCVLRQFVSSLGKVVSIGTVVNEPDLDEDDHVAVLGYSGGLHLGQEVVVLVDMVLDVVRDLRELPLLLLELGLHEVGEVIILLLIFRMFN